jgi:ferredoxin
MRPQATRWRCWASRTAGAVSVYAQGKDYHDLVKRRLKRLGRWLLDQAGGEIKVFVDTAPVMEKPLAQAAGLGWQGKHTNLLSRDFGNWVFLGAIFTTLDLPPDAPEAEHCGRCTACLDVCPTRAFPAPFQLDARRCISYLTIEHRGPVDEELRRPAGQPHLWLRRLPCRLPLEQVRRGGAGHGLCPPGRRALAGRSGGAGLMPGSGRGSQAARSSASGATVSCAMSFMPSAIPGCPSLARWRRRLVG